MDKIEILQEIIDASKEFNFVEHEILKIRKYYDTSKCININFIALIEIMCEKLDHEDINRILLTDEELEEMENENEN